ncbi:sugar ABC transporter ATP-binding protein [Clostridium sp. chh4-2]|uniref:carbohydrate ABC transporter permease n=1 Tax=Clostridium sp. chh4-2 TaxID=2067550 RepID=UPI000CCF0BBD|nr:carbohydrate ABC transporter permease [Clostridium sp. chh4-2]PNV59523.1 sugar ABC transporter ATP-binding protein [Clostridium sp. chh4-2]
MNKKNINLGKILLTAVAAVMAVGFMLPLLWMVSSSLKSSMQVFESPFRWISDRIRWDNFMQVWINSELPFWKMFLNSLTISCISVVGQLLVSSMAAYAFAKIEFKGRNIVFMLMLVTMMIPVQALIIPRFMLFHILDLYDTLWSIILPNFFNVTSIFLLRQFYLSVPDDIAEAALIDGAGHFRIWGQIMVPLTKNGLISAAILAFINSWNEYLSPLIFLPSTKNFTVALGIRWYLNDTAREYNLMMCAAASTIIPVVVLYISAQKYFEDGIATAGVKG